MAEFTKFRTALNGFNRSDVAEYIEVTGAQHQAALQTAQKQIDDLTRQLAAAQEALDSQIARAESLQQELETTKTALQSTEEALDEAMTMLTEEPAVTEPEEDYASMELEAYRRAEAMERSSNERAARLNQQLNDLLDQVSGRYEQTGQEIQVLTEDVRINLQRLEEALSDLNVIFDETKENFDSMDATDPLMEED